MIGASRYTLPLVALAAVASLAPKANGAPSDHVCWTSQQEGISEDISGYRLVLKSLGNARPDKWEQGVYQALKQLVDKHNAIASDTTIAFDVHMGAGGYDNRIRRYVTAGVLCRMGKLGGSCRNRNFWSPKTTDPFVLASSLFENLRDPNPMLTRCEEGAFGYSRDW